MMTKIHASREMHFSSYAFRMNLRLAAGGLLLTDRSLTDKRHGSGKIDEGSGQTASRGAVELPVRAQEFRHEDARSFKFRAFSYGWSDAGVMSHQVLRREPGKSTPRRLSRPRPA